MNLQGKKTYLVALGMVVYQVLRYLYEGTLPDVNMLLEAGGLATLRAGVQKALVEKGKAEK